jgi:hypothetical protein
MDDLPRADGSPENDARSLQGRGDDVGIVAFLRRALVDQFGDLATSNDRVRTNASAPSDAAFNAEPIKLRKKAC